MSGIIIGISVVVVSAFAGWWLVVRPINNFERELDDMGRRLNAGEYDDDIRDVVRNGGSTEIGPFEITRDGASLTRGPWGDGET